MKTLAIIALILTAAAAGAAPSTESVDGVLHVRNGEKPRDGTTSIILEQMWEVGGDAEDSVLFGTVNQVLAADNGTVYMLDAQLAHVEVFDREGRHLRTVGRRGEGPGEFNIPLDMVFLKDGNLGISEGFPGRIERLSTEGDPVGSIIPAVKDGAEGGFLVLVNCQSGGGNLVLSGQDVSTDTETGIQRRTYFVGTFDEEGWPVARLHETDKHLDFNNIVLDEDWVDFVWERLAVLSDGRVAMAIPRNEYQVTIFNPDGSIDRIIERPYRSWQRNAAARTRRQAWLDGLGRQFPPGTPTRMFDTEPDIVQMFGDGRGRLWVRTSRTMWEPRPGVLASFDVFDAEGTYIQEVDVLCEGRSQSDFLVFGPDDLVFRITGHVEAMLDLQTEGAMDDGGEAEPMAVVCYRRKGSL